MAFNEQGQGTTEYLIVLAIVIVIALVVVGVLGGFPKLGAGIGESQSKAYWGAIHPLGFVDWSIPSSGNGSIIVQNNSIFSVTLVDINWNGASTALPDVNVSPGARVAVSSNRMTCTAVGQKFSINVGYTYNTPDISGKNFNGVQPLVGVCQ